MYDLVAFKATYVLIPWKIQRAFRFLPYQCLVDIHLYSMKSDPFFEPTHLTKYSSRWTFQWLMGIWQMPPHTHIYIYIYAVSLWSCLMACKSILKNDEIQWVLIMLLANSMRPPKMYILHSILCFRICLSLFFFFSLSKIWFHQVIIIWTESLINSIYKFRSVFHLFPVVDIQIVWTLKLSQNQQKKKTETKRKSCNLLWVRIIFPFQSISISWSKFWQSMTFPFWFEILVYPVQFGENEFCQAHIICPF